MISSYSRLSPLDFSRFLFLSCAFCFVFSSQISFSSGGFFFFLAIFVFLFSYFCHLDFKLEHMELDGNKIVYLLEGVE